MIVIDAENSMAEYDCDIWPMHITLDRARELLQLHRDHPLIECAVRSAVLCVLIDAC